MGTQGGFLITRIKQVGGRVFERILAEKKIDAFNGAQGRILYVLWQKDGVPISDLSKETGLALTDEAKSLEKDYQEVTEEISNIYYKGFSKDEIAQLEEYLRRVLANVEERL